MNTTTKGRTVGRLVGLRRYPVKSMAAEILDTVEASWFGVCGDRRWAFVRNEATRSNFPWVTIRERGDMNRYRPSFADPSQPEQSATLVRTPAGAVLDVADPELCQELYPSGARAIKQNRGVFDTFPISLITTQTIAGLSRTVGADLSVERFRPNLLVEAVDDAPFPEDSWVGSVLRIGGLRMRIDKRDGRCAVITVDPETGQRDPSVLRAVVQEREGCLGVYGTTVEPGPITVGDDVLVEST